MDSYALRLFEGDVEVSASTVMKVLGGDNYPCTGQILDDYWRVIEIISFTEQELCLRVEKIKK